ncbi:bifunctional DNA primase/polymerase [Paludisphaera soli]|uniref:bifunctional DNA primase/polymerase n=1 Tax=Paludisphaera soli TaxID=2712865 RepID=UPI0013EB2A5A|nr:bifunctional DNA primase/polymerase [Paludisphaera soli]
MPDSRPPEDPELALVHWIRPTRRGRLIVWPTAPVTNDALDVYNWHRARAERARRRVPLLREEGLRWIGAGYSLTLTAALYKDGKTHCEKEWHLRPLRSEADFRAALAERPSSNLLVVCGPDMGPHGEWLVHVEADAAKASPWDASRAEAFDGFARFTAGMGPTPTWESRRGCKSLASIPREFGAAFHEQLRKHEHEDFPGLEVILGGWKPDGARKASSALVPPSETDGVARAWIEPTRKLAPLPDHALEYLSGVALARVAEAAARREMRAEGVLHMDDLGDEEQEAWIAFKVERLREDFARLGPAVEGAGGSNPTFAAACAIVEAGIDDEDDQMDLLEEYNDDFCRPCWDEPALRHKLEDAREVVGDRRDKEERFWAMFARARSREWSRTPAGAWIPSRTSGPGGPTR